MDKGRRRWLARSAVASMAGRGASVAGLLLGTAATPASEPGSGPASADNGCAPLLAHEVRPLTGSESGTLCERFSNEVLLIVNTASHCGFTPQFEALETLHRRYGERGLRVLGFPSDDFRQELEDEGEIASFCRLNYGVSFPMFGKIGVTGADAHPLYRDLSAATGRAPSWNFNKYLVDRTGRVLAHYGAGEQPLGERLIRDVEAAL